MKAEEIFLEIKENSDFMIDLAYSALLYNNKDLAEEVNILEEETDKLYDELLRICFKLEDEDKALSMVKLAISAEEIADAAREIADVVLRGVGIHEVFELSLRDSDEIITRVQIGENSGLKDKKIEDIESETGFWTIAIKRNNRWLFDPKDEEVSIPGDTLILKGALEGEKRLMELADYRISNEDQ